MLGILDTIFLSFILFFIFVDTLLRNYEDCLPALSKLFKFGNFAYRGERVKFLSVFEISKAFYRHFYLHTMILSVTLFMYAVGVYFFNVSNNKLRMTLHYFCQKKEPSVSVAAALLTLLLIIVQASRRYYETCYLQVFSKSAKMNIFHYVTAIVHYTGIVLAAVCEAPLFCGDQNINRINWIDLRTAATAIPCIAVFFFAWREQFKSHVILSNLRRDKKSGKVVTEEYKIPVGRLFTYVSSPHRFCEVIIYLVFFLNTPTTTYFIVFLWVLLNQVLCAQYTNDWYKKTFKDFPQDKKAIIPGIL